MNKNMTYTIKFSSTIDNLEFFEWVSKQNDPDEFIMNALKKSMIENEMKRSTISKEDLDDIINSIDDYF